MLNLVNERTDVLAGNVALFEIVPTDVGKQIKMVGLSNIDTYSLSLYKGNNLISKGDKDLNKFCKESDEYFYNSLEELTKNIYNVFKYYREIDSDTDLQKLGYGRYIMNL